MPKLEPGTELQGGTTQVIPLSAITGDPSHTQLVSISGNGTMIHVSLFLLNPLSSDFSISKQSLVLGLLLNSIRFGL